MIAIARRRLHALLGRCRYKRIEEKSRDPEYGRDFNECRRTPIDDSKVARDDVAKWRIGFNERADLFEVGLGTRRPEDRGLQAKAPFDLFMRNAFASIELRETFLGLREQNQSLDRIIDRCVLGQLPDNLEHALARDAMWPSRILPPAYQGFELEMRSNDLPLSRERQTRSFEGV